MALGQAAGVAAALATHHGTTVQDVGTTLLQETLADAGQVLAP